MPDFGPGFPRFTSRPGSATGSGFNRIWLKTEKIAAFAPMPRPSETMATVVTNGVLNSVRRASFRLNMMEVGRASAPVGCVRLEAVGRVIVDHAGSLHERVADRGPDELEPALLQVAAHRLVVGKLPDVAIEGAEFLLHRQERSRVRDRRVDFQAVAHDAGVGEQRAFLRGAVLRDLPRVETIERLPVRGPLPEDRDPTQARLRALEDEHLEEPPVVVQRHAPFLIVVTDVERIVAAPAATLDHTLYFFNDLSRIALNSFPGFHSGILSALATR